MPSYDGIIQRMYVTSKSPRFTVFLLFTFVVSGKSGIGGGDKKPPEILGFPLLGFVIDGEGEKGGDVTELLLTFSSSALKFIDNLQ